MYIKFISKNKGYFDAGSEVFLDCNRFIDFAHQTIEARRITVDEWFKLYNEEEFYSNLFIGLSEGVIETEPCFLKEFTVELTDQSLEFETRTAIDIFLKN